MGLRGRSKTPERQPLLSARHSTFVDKCGVVFCIGPHSHVQCDVRAAEAKNLVMWMARYRKNISSENNVSHGDFHMRDICMQIEYLAGPRLVPLSP